MKTDQISFKGTQKEKAIYDSVYKTIINKQANKWFKFPKQKEHCQTCDKNICV
jgi:hypothetical protein